MTTQISSDLSAMIDKLQVQNSNGSNELGKVLALLGSDDDFRTQLIADPVAALAGIGITLDPALVPAERILPSKESILTDQGVVRKRLETTANMVIFLLSGN